MRRPRLTWLASILVATAVASPGLHADTAGSPSPGSSGKSLPGAIDIQQLIESLGSQRYVARREAEQRLLEIGMQAFDQIDAATDHPDPEIAARCRYLISEMTVRWTRRDDPPQVKAELADYANQNEPRRLAVVRSLGLRNEPWAIAPLCRICRYDPSLAVASRAAIELLQVDKFPLRYSAEEAQTLRQEVGASVRPAADWIRLLADQVDDPANARQAWQAAIDRAEQAAAADPEDRALAEQAVDLSRNLARIEIQQGAADQLIAVVDLLLARDDVSAVNELNWLLDWTTRANDSQLVDALLARYAGKLEASKIGLYLMARTRAQQGRPEAAEQLAERAFQAVDVPGLGGAPQHRYDLARLLVKEGQIEWARRELRAAIDEVPEGSDLQARAAVVLANSLHDWQLDDQASQVLSEFTEPLRNNDVLRKQYEASVRNSMRPGIEIPTLTPLARIEGYQSYYLACHLHRQGDVDAEWEALERSLKFDGENIDIVIAMYRASEGNPERRATALQAIQERCRAIERLIDDYPYPTFEFDISQLYNEWAWLVSNTEGDFAKAVRYSHKSLDLFQKFIVMTEQYRPEESAGLLDTLGRCYYAAGDLDAAIKYQSQAVEYEPYSRVMRRQLDQFREARDARGS